MVVVIFRLFIISVAIGLSGCGTGFFNPIPNQSYRSEVVDGAREFVMPLAEVGYLYPKGHNKEEIALAGNGEGKKILVPDQVSPQPSIVEQQAIDILPQQEVRESAQTIAPVISSQASRSGGSSESTEETSSSQDSSGLVSQNLIYAAQRYDPRIKAIKFVILLLSEFPNSVQILPLYEKVPDQEYVAWDWGEAKCRYAIYEKDAAGKRQGDSIASGEVILTRSGESFAAKLSREVEISSLSFDLAITLPNGEVISEIRKEIIVGANKPV